MSSTGPTQRATRKRLAVTTRLCWTLLPFVIAATLSAQQLDIRSFTPDQGLAASQVWTIYQDRIGVLWFGTAAGLSRYDGTSFGTISIADGLPDPLVRTIIQSRDGRLWFGTNAGLASYDGRAIRRYDAKDGVAKRPVWTDTIDLAGNLWFGTQDGGLILYDGSSFHTYTNRDGLPSGYVYALFTARDGTIWAGTRDGELVRFKPGADRRLTAIRRFAAADGLPNYPIHAIAEDRAGDIFVGTRGGGLIRFDGSRFVPIEPRSGLRGRDVYTLLLNHAGELVVGTVDAGVSICDAPGLLHCRSVTRRNGLRVDNVYALLEDREGSLWVGLNNGVSQLVTEQFRSYGETEGLPDNGIMSVFADRGGEMWFGTYRGLARGRPDPSDGTLRFTTYSTKDGLPSDGVWDVLRDRSGDLWVATRSGLARLRDDGRFEKFTKADGLASDYVYSLFEDRAGNLWLATLEGVSKAAPRKRGERPVFETLSTASGFKPGQIYAIAEDARGRIWIGTAAEGIAVVDGASVRYYTTRDGLGSDSVNAITPASDGSVWIGTGGGGLGRFDGSRFVRFGKEAGLASDSVVAIAEAGDGTVWLGTSHGVDVFDPNVRRRDGGRGSVVRHFDNRNGLVSNECLTSSAIARTPDGTLWFGTSNGVTELRPSLDSSLRPAPEASVRRVVAPRRVFNAPFAATTSPARNGAEWISSSPIVLRPDENSVHVEFRAMSYRNPDSVRYSLQLAPFDAGWLDETSVPFKEYTNLPPDTYTLRVRSRLGQAPWGPSSSPVTIVVQPSLLQTWWMRAILALGVILAAVLLMQLRTRRMRAHQRELKAIIERRTSELVRRALELEAANREIQAANQTKSRFLASMSHELRTPLNAILGFSEVLSARLDDRADARERRFLQNINESGQHLLSLINDLLDLSKIEAGHMDLHAEPIEVAPLIERVRALLAGVAARRGIETIVRADKNLPPVNADESKLRQILFNLLSNAIKFSHENAKVEIEAAPLPAKRSPIRIDSIVLSVIDHGIGIKPEDRRFLFDEFQQSDEGVARGGTGLGLSIVKKLTELHRGIVTVDSSPGAGSTFRVYLPAATRTRVGNEDRAAEAKAEETSATRNQ